MRFALTAISTEGVSPTNKRDVYRNREDGGGVELVMTLAHGRYETVKSKTK